MNQSDIILLQADFNILLDKYNKQSETLATTEAKILDNNIKYDALSRQLAERNRIHERDIELISDALINEAENRGWCDTYDEFIKELNHKLDIPLRERVSNYDVTITVTRTQTQRVTITVENQLSEEDAHDAAVDKVESYPDDYLNDRRWDIEEFNIEVDHVSES